MFYAVSSFTPPSSVRGIAPGTLNRAGERIKGSEYTYWLPQFKHASVENIAAFVIGIKEKIGRSG
jgi:hypothetical protein